MVRREGFFAVSTVQQQDTIDPVLNIAAGGVTSSTLYVPLG